jgi:hypothetical protein
MNLSREEQEEIDRAIAMSMEMEEVRHHDTAHVIADEGTEF